MPPKIRELAAQLEQAGFTNRGGKGSHRKTDNKPLPTATSGKDYANVLQDAA